jgi:hypothetical protein
LTCFTASGEIWLSLLALGFRSDFSTAVILESGALAIRGGAFLVPGALGVQEGGYILLGGLLGIPGDIALSLSLVRRIRELALGIPALIVWQFMEARGSVVRPARIVVNGPHRLRTRSNSLHAKFLESLQGLRP